VAVKFLEVSVKKIVDNRCPRHVYPDLGWRIYSAAIELCSVA